MRVVFYPLRSQRAHEISPWLEARRYRAVSELEDTTLENFQWAVVFPDTPEGNEHAIEFKLRFA